MSHQVWRLIEITIVTPPPIDFAHSLEMEQEWSHCIQIVAGIYYLNCALCTKKPKRHLVCFFFRLAKMMPSSPLVGRSSRSGTSSPKVFDYDPVEHIKDSVIGELASRIGRPIPEFNKNKRGMISLNSPDFALKWNCF